MEWYIIQNLKSGKEILGKAATKEKAEKKMSKMNKKELYIQGVPDFQAGLRLYKHGEVYYQTILKETKTLYLLNNTTNLMLYDDPVMKERMLNYFINAGFESIEEYDSNYINNYYDGKDDDLEIPEEKDEDNTNMEETAFAD